MARKTLKVTSPIMTNTSLGNYDVSDFQYYVKAFGFNPGDIDGKYGNKSKEACIAFQRAKGLSVDGICGPKTWNELEKAHRTLKNTSPMMTGEDVTYFQKKMNEKGYSLSVDGKYGKNCEAVCRQFQKARGLSVDGICGKNTWAKIDESAPVPSEKPHSEHFKFSEFRCKDGSDVPEKYWGNLQRLMNKLEELRTACGNRAITITSGYRSPEYNEALRKKDPNGVAKNSQHLYATAADIRVSGMTPKQVRTIADRVFSNGGVGGYNSFTHVDVRGHHSRWGTW